MLSFLYSISEKGRQRAVPAVQVGSKASVVIKGGFLKIASVHDEYWLRTKDLPDPVSVLESLMRSDQRPDIFTFTQPFPDVTPKYDWRLEWDNLAVAEFGSYGEWHRKINKGAKSSIKKAIKEGVCTEVVPFNDRLVQGISSIYNEAPIRQGRRFWHYGKPLTVVKQENITCLDRSEFIGAYCDDELIGFVKLVFDGSIAKVMQILSQTRYYAKCPTNALLSGAVKLCESKGVRYLIYSSYDYGRSADNSLTRFKRHNGFERVNIPRYYFPLTLKGRIALCFGLQKGLRSWVPFPIYSVAKSLRSMWLRVQFRER